MQVHFRENNINEGSVILFYNKKKLKKKKKKKKKKIINPIPTCKRTMISDEE